MQFLRAVSPALIACFVSQRLVGFMLELPPRVLASSAYNVGTLTGAAVMQGCPALTLIDLLFSERMLEECSSQERYVHDQTGAARAE